MQIKDDLSKHLYLSISKKEIQAKIEQNALADNQNVNLDANAKNENSLDKRKKKQKDEKKHDPYKDKKNKLALLKNENLKDEPNSDLIKSEVTLKKLNAI